MQQWLRMVSNSMQSYNPAANFLGILHICFAPLQWLLHVSAALLLCQLFSASEGMAFDFMGAPLGALP